MGAGYHGGFGNTYGASNNSESNEPSSNPNQTNNASDNQDKVSLPKNDSQLNHIFGNRPGHLPDTPGNRQALEDLANDQSKYIGTDTYGNDWNAQIEPDGSQTWVRYQNGVINEGGRNTTPRSWDNTTGLNDNPFKNKGKNRGNNGSNGSNDNCKGGSNK